MKIVVYSNNDASISCPKDASTAFDEMNPQKLVKRGIIISNEQVPKLCGPCVQSRISLSIK